MSTGLYSITVRPTGFLLTAAAYNADQQNHVTNQNPSMTGALSDNVTQMRTQQDPGGVGTETLAASLAEELEELRFVLAKVIGRTYWYDYANYAITVSSGNVGIGMTPVNILDITLNQNAGSLAAILNNSAGAAALAAFTASNGTSKVTIGQLGTGFTPVSVYTTNQSFIEASGANGLVISTDVSAPIVLATSGTERWRVNKLGALTTGSYESGGFSNGQASIAPSATEGMQLRAKGSVDDLEFLNSAGTKTAGNATGTTTWAFAGDLSVGGNLTVTGTSPTGTFTNKFTSTQQAIPSAGTTLTVAHSLGAAPFGINLVLHCTTAEWGWSIGDEVHLGACGYTATWASGDGLLSWADATNVNVVQGSGGVIDIFRKDTGVTQNLTQANWKLIVKAWL